MLKKFLFVFFVIILIPTEGYAGNYGRVQGGGSGVMLSGGDGITLSLTTITTDTIVLVWDAVTYTIIGYRLYQSFDGGEFILVDTITSGTQSTLSTINSGEYVWYVTTYDDINESDASNSVIVIKR